MGEEPEKRFHAIMDKLFPSPPKSKSDLASSSTTTSSLSGAPFTRDGKRWNIGSELLVLDPKVRGNEVGRLHSSVVSSGSALAPPCRPWDRGDLFRRLSTFKSMTWFAKPKAVSAINCARRGWVNVDMDVISCEACQARLLFSTPSSWTQEQVEKAASVFCLKLDNGHKLLCPWIDNACDEMLVQFPPAPAAILADNYKKHYSALLQLAALPLVLLPDAYGIKNPQLEQFLKGSVLIDSGDKPNDDSLTVSSGDEHHVASSASYYQALKLISLCGWEPRLLPYIVDCKDDQSRTSKPVHLTDQTGEISNVNNTGISISSGASLSMEATNNNVAFTGEEHDPHSVVFDCKLCGASVGLWTFSLVSQPVECVRLIGYTEVNGEDGFANQEDAISSGAGASVAHDLGVGNHVEKRERVKNDATTGATSSSERLRLTIAGGPPPAKQDFKATISLPLIGRNLRARLSSDSDCKDRPSVQNLFLGHVSHTSNFPTGQDSQPEVTEPLQDKRPDDECCGNTRNDVLCDKNNQPTILNVGISDQQHKIGTENNMSEEVEHNCGQGSESRGLEPSVENPVDGSLSVVESSREKDKVPENAENVGMLKPVVGNPSSSQVDYSYGTTQDAISTIRRGETSKNETSMTVATDVSQFMGGVETIGDLLPISRGELDHLQSAGKDLLQLPSDKTMTFDPIRQHRHFCPWISSTGNTAPGWQQTLTALLRQKEFSYPSTDVLPSYIKVDDPVGSVKKLFSPPSAKRVKLTPSG